MTNDPPKTPPAELDAEIKAEMERRAKIHDLPVGMSDKRIGELETFIVQMYGAMKSGAIRDYDTNWRMTEEIMPLNLECFHKKDSAEISAHYRKIHLSDILSSAIELLDLYQKRQRHHERESVGHPVEPYEYLFQEAINMIEKIRGF